MSLDILVWIFLASFTVHLVEESAIAAGNILFDLFGGHWIIICLVWPFGFALHGFSVHLFWTIRQKNLSPGLATSVIYWILTYFYVRYGFLAGQISSGDFWTGAIIGIVTVGLFLTFAPTVVIPALIRKR